MLIHSIKYLKKSGKKQPFKEIVLYCFQVERLLWLGIWGWWYGWNLAGYEGCGKRYVEPTNQQKKLVTQTFFVDIAIFDFSQSTPCQVWRMGEWSGRCGASPSDGVTRREWRVASERGSPPQEVRGTPDDAATRGTNAATGSRKKTALPAKEIGGVNQQSPGGGLGSQSLLDESNFAWQENSCQIITFVCFCHLSQLLLMSIYSYGNVSPVFQSTSYLTVSLRLPLSKKFSDYF